MSLIAAVRARLEVVAESVLSIDDLALRETQNELDSLTPATFAESLRPFVEAYQAQIDPLGRDVGGTTRLDLNLPPGTHFEYEAVTVKTPRGPRLAQVAHEENRTPKDGATYGATYHRYIFVRWIDESFAPVVGTVKEMEAHDIEGLSFADLMGEM